MIPKILHQTFLGDWDFTPLDIRCHASWRKYLADFRVHNWGPKDITIPDSPWLEAAFRACPVNAVSYLRYWTLWTYGGIGLDNDMEILKPIDECLQHGAFVGFQRDDTEYMCLNYSIIGAEKGHPWMRQLLDLMEQCSPDDSPLRFCNIMLTETMQAQGLMGFHQQEIGDIMVYPREVFYPWRHEEQFHPSCITERTLGIHHWEASWKK